MFEVYFIYWDGFAYEESFETLAEAITYCKAREEDLTCEESYEVRYNDKLVYES